MFITFVQMFKIEKNIKRSKIKMSKYFFKKMKIGDSFIINEVYTRTNMQAGFAAANAWNTKCNGKKWKFSIRKVKEDDQFKVRIWRIK